ncbi:C45 family peptidase [Glutamicibacter sp.]|uniref:C45 family peptidase n=1 Tax=Glutamicibacter sp. TaxID=1931995 RepID=UPI0028BEE218|nr:C45 family peptidase [Glutamicibacter sp.]
MTTFPAPRPAQRLQLQINSTDPHTRGIQRGEQLGAALADGFEVYQRFFTLGALGPAQVRAMAERSLEDINNFSPQLAQEILGTAQGAGLETWQVAALNARTEILAASATTGPGECSTIVRTAGTEQAPEIFGVQTWDWHVELAAFWHTQQVAGAAHSFAGITEHGILSKIGINDAGLALHFNILGHEDDGVGGIPMHVLSAHVLQNAGSVAQAVELVREAPISSSGSFALFDQHSAVLLDMTPHGVFEVPQLQPGLHLRTNHFLTQEPKAKEKNWLYQPDSSQRFDFLAARLGQNLPQSAAQVFDSMLTNPGEPAVTCVPDMALPMGQRWASLATVVLEPAARTARVLDGTPAEGDTRPWYTLNA